MEAESNETVNGTEHIDRPAMPHEAAPRERARWSIRSRQQQAFTPPPSGFDRRLNIGHLLTTITLIVAVFGWASLMDRRVAILEEKEHTTRQYNQRQDVELAEHKARERERFRELESKVSRIDERINSIHGFNRFPTP